MNDYKINNSVKNLDELYVITKKYAGNIYFARSKYNGARGFLVDTKNPIVAYIFNDLSIAKAFCEDLNEGRKKIKHRVEKASRYFTTNIEFSTNWFNTNITIRNRYIPVKNLSKCKKKLNDIEENEQILKAHINEKIVELKNIKKDYESYGLKNIKKDYESYGLKNIKKDYESYGVSKDVEIRKAKEEIEKKYSTKKQNTEERIDNLTKYIENLKGIDCKEIVDKAKTKHDDKYKILYGSNL